MVGVNLQILKKTMPMIQGQLNFEGVALLPATYQERQLEQCGTSSAGSPAWSVVGSLFTCFKYR